MQEPKFTKGPWRAWHNGYCWQFDDAAEGRPLGDVCATEVSRGTAAAAANAQLVASAPELYAEAERSRIALENAAALLAVAWPTHAKAMREQADALAKVLAKARGEVVADPAPDPIVAPLFANDVGGCP